MTEKAKAPAGVDGKGLGTTTTGNGVHPNSSTNERPANTNPPAEPDTETYRQFAYLFRGRSEAYGKRSTGKGGKVDGQPPYKDHLAGRVLIGIYPLMDKDVIAFAASDFDEKDTPDEGKAIAQQAVKMLHELGVPAWLERSKSKGWHVWLFFNNPVPAFKARRLLAHVNEKCGRPSSEIFPKQDNLENVVYGNYINLPYPAGKPGTDGRQAMWNGDTVLTLEQFLSEAGESRITLAGLDAALGAAGLSLAPETTPTATAKTPGRTFSENNWLPCMSAMLESGLKEGQRDECLFTAAKHARRAGKTQAEALVYLEHANDTCDTPLDKNTLATKVKSAYIGKKGAGYTSLGCDNPLWAESFCPGRDQCPVFAAKRIVVNGRHLHEVSADAAAALAAANTPPNVFTIDGRLARLVQTESGGVKAQVMNREAVRGVLDRAAAFMSCKQIQGENRYTKTCPPNPVVEDFMEMLEWPNIPPLTGIVSAPIAAPNGALITTPGYHEAGAVYFQPTTDAPLGDTRPTPQNVKNAKGLIEDTLLADFPFKDAASKANAIGLLISGHVLRLVDAPAPIVLIDATSEGTGKTLLMDTLLSPFFQGSTPVLSEPTEEKEWRQQIATTLAEAPSHIVFDNVKRPVRSGSLAAATTTTSFKNRILGVSQNATLPVRCAWVITGNNVNADPDIARRMVWVRLESNEEDPAQRTGFKIEDLRGWLKSEHCRVTTAALTLVRNWSENGRPDFTGRVLGGYESWSRVVGGILEAAGIEGFLGNLLEFRQSSDPEREAWKTFIRTWYSSEPLRKEAGVKDLFPLAIADETLTPFLTSKEERGQKTQLGSLLKKKLGKVVVLTDFPNEGESLKVKTIATGSLHRAGTYAIEIVPEEV